MESPPRDELVDAARRLLTEELDRSVIVADREGAVRYANRQARTIMGWAGTGLLAAPPLTSIPVAPPIQDRLGRDTGPWDAETTIDVGEGTIPVRIATTPITLMGRTAGWLVLITDLRDLSTVVAERDRARKNDMAKTRSLHMVAHDLSGPLTILNGYVSLVLDGSIGIEDLEEVLPMLGDQLEHMQRLVQVLLDTARLEEGRLELERVPLDLANFVEDVVSRMRAPETGHRLIVRRRAAELPVLADPIRLHSIIRNLVTNAIKYSPEGTAVTCTLQLDGEEATLEVADQGSGIDDEDLGRLFNRFGRVGDLTANPGGVGLGLFLSRELARLHGGDVDAASEVGKGSRFKLRLPLRSAGNR